MVGAGFELYCVVDGMDVDAETKRLTVEKKRIAKIVLGIENKMKKFNDHVPQQVVEDTKKQYANMKLQFSSVEKTLKYLADG